MAIFRIQIYNHRAFRWDCYVGMCIEQTTQQICAGARSSDDEKKWDICNGFLHYFLLSFLRMAATSDFCGRNSKCTFTLVILTKKIIMIIVPAA